MLQGTGIRMGGGEATISGSKFRHNLSANQFFQNKTAISVNTNSSTPVNLDLSCNIFEPGTSATAPYGRWTNGGEAWGIKVLSGSLGEIGRYRIAQNDYLSGANVWPATTTDRANKPSGVVDINAGSPPAWQSPSNWQSIVSTQTTAPIYKRYWNEFLGSNGLDLTIAQEFNNIVRSDAQDDPNGFLCANTIEVLLPESVANGGNPSARVDADEELLGQNKPNPTNGFSCIRYAIPSKFKEAKIEVSSILSFHPLKSIECKPARGEICVDLSGYAKGIYVYRLIVDGKAIGTKKMIIQ